LVVELQGRATFVDAEGIVDDIDGSVQARNAQVQLSGELRLRPKADLEAGRRMVTSLDGSIYQFTVQAPAGVNWSSIALGAAGGALLVGSAAYAWPAFRWRAARFLLLPLYARLKREQVLENPLRDDILQTVQQQPGISASELGRRLACGWGTLVYHLTVLERMKLVSSAREGRHKRFFAQGRIHYSDKGAVGLLANPAARNILDAIRAQPGVIQKELGERLELSPGTIAWHVERLAEQGLIVREEEGRVVRYYPSDRLLDLTRQLAA
jgi:DNA-binding transcriptional ArsR family regulator